MIKSAAVYTNVPLNNRWPKVSINILGVQTIKDGAVTLHRDNSTFPSGTIGVDYIIIQPIEAGWGVGNNHLITGEVNIGEQTFGYVININTLEESNLDVADFPWATYNGHFASYGFKYKADNTPLSIVFKPANQFLIPDFRTVQLSDGNIVSVQNINPLSSNIHSYSNGSDTTVIGNPYGLMLNDCYYTFTRDNSSLVLVKKNLVTGASSTLAIDSISTESDDVRIFIVNDDSLGIVYVSSDDVFKYVVVSEALSIVTTLTLATPLRDSPNADINYIRSIAVDGVNVFIQLGAASFDGHTHVEWVSGSYAFGTAELDIEGSYSTVVPTLFAGRILEGSQLNGVPRAVIISTVDNTTRLHAIDFLNGPPVIQEIPITFPQNVEIVQIMSNIMRIGWNYYIPFAPTGNDDDYIINVDILELTASVSKLVGVKGVKYGFTNGSNMYVFNYDSVRRVSVNDFSILDTYTDGKYITTAIPSDDKLFVYTAEGESEV